MWKRVSLITLTVLLAHAAIVAGAMLAIGRAYVRPRPVLVFSDKQQYRALRMAAVREAARLTNEREPMFAIAGGLAGAVVGIVLARVILRGEALEAAAIVVLLVALVLLMLPAEQRSH